MKNTLILMSFILILLCSAMVFAGDTNINTAALIHQQLKTTFYSECIEKIPRATPALCDCLSQKITAKLDDDALNKCSANDAACLTKAITDAGISAFTEDSIKACSR